MEILLQHIIFTTSRSSRHRLIPVYDIIKRFNLDDTARWDKIANSDAWYCHQDFAIRSNNPLKFIKNYPEFAERQCLPWPMGICND